MWYSPVTLPKRVRTGTPPYQTWVRNPHPDSLGLTLPIGGRPDEGEVNMPKGEVKKGGGSECHQSERGAGVTNLKL